MENVTPFHNLHGFPGTPLADTPGGTVFFTPQSERRPGDTGHRYVVFFVLLSLLCFVFFFFFFLSFFSSSIWEQTVFDEYLFSPTISHVLKVGSYRLYAHRGPSLSQQEIYKTLLYIFDVSCCVIYGVLRSPARILTVCSSS